MLKIRLQRIGRKNDPSFRIVVTESVRGPKSGRYVELLGFHNPRQNTVRLNNERVKHWIGMGAQVSGTVHNLLVSEGVIEGAKINVLPKKSPIAKEAEAEAAPGKDAGAPASPKADEEPVASEADNSEETPETAPEEVNEQSGGAEEPAEDEVKEDGQKEKESAADTADAPVSADSDTPDEAAKEEPTEEKTS